MIGAKISEKPEDKTKAGGDDAPLPEMNANIKEYLQPDRSMFEDNVETIEQFHQNFALEPMEE